MHYKGRRLTLERLSRGLKRRAGGVYPRALRVEFWNELPTIIQKWFLNSRDEETDPRFEKLPHAFSQQSSFAWILGVLFSKGLKPGHKALDLSAAGESADVSTAFLASVFGEYNVDSTSLSGSGIDARESVRPRVNILGETLDQLAPTFPYEFISVLGRSAGWPTLFQSLFKLESLLADDGYLVFSIVTDMRAAARKAAHAKKLVSEFTARFGNSRLTLGRLQRELAFSPFRPIGLVPLVTPRSSGKSAAWVIAKKDRAFVEFRNEALIVFNNLAVGDWVAVANTLAPDGRSTPLLMQFRDRLRPYASKFLNAAKKLESSGKGAQAISSKFVAYLLEPSNNSEAVAGFIEVLRVQGELPSARQIFEECNLQLRKSEPLQMEALLLHLADGAQTPSDLAKAAPKSVEALHKVAGLTNALVMSDWRSAALALDPLFRADTENADIFRPLLAGLAPKFSAQSKFLVKAGDASAGTSCALAAWTLAPDNIAFAVELIARLRIDKFFGLAEFVLSDAKERFPDHPNILLQSALVAAARGEGARATQELLAFTKIYPRFSSSQRRSMMSVLREFVRECQSAGVANESPHPLLVPEIFDAYRSDLRHNTARWFEAPFAKIFEDESMARAHIRSAARASAGPTPTNRPLRLLFITSGNWTFLLNLFRYFEAEDTRIQFRTYDFSMTEEIIAKEHAHELYGPVRFGLDPAAVWKRVDEAEATLSELVEWADLVVCEWGTAHAVWLSRFLPVHKRLVVRIHSYEAFTQWPFFMNFGGVDGLIFVADHVRRFSDLQFRWSRFPLRAEVLPNFNFLQKFVRPKNAEARRTLAMVGYSNLNKDPLMAAEILARLRKDDPAWRLVLVGHAWKSSLLKGRELDYFQRFEAFVAENDLSSAIVYRNFTRDIPEVMRDVGFILSCSWREGTHETILEGMASGAIPVVRKWPMVHEFGAPESVYPDLEYYDTVDDAVNIVRRHSDTDSFERKARASTQYAMERFDMEVVFPNFEKLISEFAQIP